MAEDQRIPFKEGLDAAAVAVLGERLRRVRPDFEREAFERTANEGLQELELKDRVRHLIAALHEHLPESYAEALEVILAAANEWQPAPREDGYGGFVFWPLVDFVGAHGLEEFDLSMRALRRLTTRWSGEFAIRPFLDADPERALGHLRGWLDDEDERVRRLVSEGTRTRLPWGERLGLFIEDPGPVLELLEELRDDPSATVRRSVANNLNDLSKDHPDLVVEVASRWYRPAPSDRERVVRHALRTLVKQGHPGALSLLGYDPSVEVEVAGLSVEPATVAFGGELRFRFEIVSKSGRAEPLVLDYAVHHVKAAGHRSAKVFKLKTLRLAAGGRKTVERKHSFRSVTVRRYHPGRHAIEILVNGRSRGQVEFDLQSE